MKPTQRAAMLMGRGSKRKRGPEENGKRPLSEPEEGAPPSLSRSCWNRNKWRKIEVKVRRMRYTGVVCSCHLTFGFESSLFKRSICMSGLDPVLVCGN